ncbi:C40 family peptidase [Sphingobium sp. Ant17]|uniref:C40 family peptidase n=1 Tax=Sphingobium sp. Ant17 TaxID=1461752 RepID=UPI000449EB45|nr:NlpC/P60 family protein [Sphingobium sp. Ant17]EXS70406.1 glycoside hydrolase [Sphingobium sp. Ant17]|tara:strand:+ start:19577 stop:20485 length:909 start_codon:yes stop_codon:yes gene_type:complete
MIGTTTAKRNAPPERSRFKLDGRSVALDRRIHAARGDLADLALAGILFSAHYARAVPLTCVMPGTPILSAPSPGAEAVTELLRGETFHALDVMTDWAWGFCGHDGYVGYIRREALDVAETASHRIVAQTAPLFRKPDIKSQVLDYWPMGALFTGEVEGAFLSCAEGYIHVRHAAPISDPATDWVAIAERYLGQPYVWGGRGHRGIDCSGLVQVALGQCGMAVPRDTDLQCEGIGLPIESDAALRRGDLIFFPGHVGIMTDGKTLLHANAHWMAVVKEPLADVVARLADDHAQPIIARRRIGA